MSINMVYIVHVSYRVCCVRFNRISLNSFQVNSCNHTSYRTRFGTSLHAHYNGLNQYDRCPSNKFTVHISPTAFIDDNFRTNTNLNINRTYTTHRTTMEEWKKFFTCMHSIYSGLICAGEIMIGNPQALPRTITCTSMRICSNYKL